MLKSITALLLTLLTAAPAEAQCHNSKVTISCRGPEGFSGGVLCNEKQLACPAGQRMASFNQASFDCNKRDKNNNFWNTCVYDVLQHFSVSCCSKS
ncbi:hypothetical protein CDEST_08656 [Colletotrichum destructivum]|uniref:Uncharacterized protein n=1 Tax=Colletotrichum destructivum TaxID=34406 RepID=A0AAX4IK63_9PEZI|nr:hypothetical protein CDEST_08656 [Colletotrichum destructivum]